MTTKLSDKQIVEASERDARAAVGAEAVLSVQNLVVHIPTRRGLLVPVHDVSFDIQAGEILGVVGESGAGKSLTGSAIIGLLERPGRIAGGTVLLKNRRIDNLPDREMREVRGRDVGMIFQDPLTSLNPLLTVGQQLMETARTHLGLSANDARARAIELLTDVGIPAAESRIKAYPHEFSGGMRQRVVIALALIADPGLIIADEPTTALDVSVQAQVLTLLKQVCRKRGASVMLITHDMGVIAETTDRVAVMYAGNLVEIGDTQTVLSSPSHPYTSGLMAATPNTVASDSRSDRLSQIPGSMPGLLEVPVGCSFHPRCQKKLGRCEQEAPQLVSIVHQPSQSGTVKTGEVACHLFDENTVNIASAGAADTGTQKGHD